MSFDSAANRATNIGGLGVSYDAAGNMTSDGTNTCQWDAEGRLISVNNGSTWSATYNAFDQRVERISTCCGRTEELFDPSGQLLGHLNGANGIWWEEYVDFDGRLLWYYTQATNTSRYFHVNALGSLGLATDQTGAPVEEMLYYPFGVRWQNTTGFGWDEKFAQFAQRDDDIQKYEASFREYDPGLGRWMTPDPLGGDVTNPQSLNRYAYVLNNPTSLNDPLGLCSDYDYSYTDANGNYVIHSDVGPCPPDGLGLNDLCRYSGYGCGYNAYSGSPYPYSGGDGGGAGSSASKPAPAGGPLPSYAQVLKSFNQCAANFADKYSVASLLHLNNVPILGSLLRSSTATASHLLFGNSPKEYVPAGANLATGAKAGTIVAAAATRASRVPVDQGFQSIFTTIPPTQFGETDLGTSLVDLATRTGSLLDKVLPVQIAVDEALYGAGEAACTAQAFGWQIYEQG